MSSRRRRHTEAPLIHDEAAFDAAVENVLARTLRYARERDYTGWDYWDGTSSLFLQVAPIRNKWVTIAVQEGIKRAPMNLRPLFLVEQRRNFKGTALFAMANANAAAIRLDSDGDEGRTDTGGLGDGGNSDGADYAAEATRLARWLVDNRVRGYHGFAGSHRHVMQELDGVRLPNQGDVVSTSFGVKALLALRESDPTFAEMARSAADFVIEDLDYTERDDGATVNYATCDTGEYYTLNAIGLAGRLFCDLYEAFGDADDRRRAERLLDFVVAHQEPEGGWKYRVPAESSHLSMDNHHNGFVVECLLRHGQVTGSDRYAAALDHGYRFYRDVLFEPNGAPNWEEDAAYPRDIHAAAQGILVATWMGDFEFARRVIAWTLDHLYAANGQFWFRKQRFYTKRITLMRWGQAWMAYALSEYLLARQPHVAAVVEPTVARPDHAGWPESGGPITVEPSTPTPTATEATAPTPSGVADSTA